MVDPVQGALLDWVERKDRRRGEEAVRLLLSEWRPRVRNFLESPGPDEVDEVLDEAICALCVSEPGRRPRVLAPASCDSPPGWRRQVLKNFLRDRARKGGRRRHLEQAAARGLAPATEHALWKEQKEARAQGISPPERLKLLPPPPEDAEDVELGLDLMRSQVVELAPRLVIRRRVITLLALRADPSPFSGELAEELDEPKEDTQGRVDRALVSTEDEEHAPLTLPRVRVPWPKSDEKDAREAARKNLRRAQDDLHGWLRGKK